MSPPRAFVRFGGTKRKASPMTLMSRQAHRGKSVLLDSLDPSHLDPRQVFYTGHPPCLLPDDKTGALHVYERKWILILKNHDKSIHLLTATA